MEQNPTFSQDEKESYIVQNITLGYHFVSDIKLQFAPRQVIDLTWEDESFIKRSKDLKDSLRSGILRKLSAEEYEKTMNMQYDREKKLLLREQQQQVKYQKINADGKDMIADTFDVAKSQKKRETLDITGTASHPASYAAAYEIAQAQYDERGESLAPEEFANFVEQNPAIVQNLLRSTRVAAVEKNHTAFYASPPTADGMSGVRMAQMTNFNRDGYYAGEHDFQVHQNTIRDAVDFDADYDVNDNDSDFAEEINLENEE